MLRYEAASDLLIVLRRSAVAIAPFTLAADALTRGRGGDGVVSGGASHACSLPSTATSGPAAGGSAGTSWGTRLPWSYSSSVLAEAGAATARAPRRAAAIVRA